MARLNSLDGGRSVFVPTEFQADFSPEVGGDAWSADLLVFNNPSPMEKSRLLQILGLEALGEPMIDPAEQVSGLALLALPTPQPGQAHRRP